jgi:nucleoside-diphosphate-sugar epimerase
MQVPAQHLDSYTVTKAAADALVLQANAPASGLVTCVIR